MLKNIGRELSLVVAILLMFIIFTAINPIYITSANIISIINQSTINSLLAIGITFVIITGGIDLSIGSTFAVVIVVVGDLLVRGIQTPAAIAIGCLLGATLGAINGLVITKMKLQPFIATLGTMSVYRGVAFVITGGWPVLNIPASFRNVMDGKIVMGISSAMVILFLVAITCSVLLKHTKFGTYILAIGGNEEATRLSGVNVDKTKILAYILCGVTASLAGMIMLARLGTGEPTAGQSYELDAIAATAIGGASLAGGRGSVLGTVLGAILLSSLKVGLVVAGVDSFWQFIATGAIIVIAAYFDVLQTKFKAFKIRRQKAEATNEV